MAAPGLGRAVVWAAIVLLVGAFALAPVLLSHDVYSYVDYARLGARHGLDPYVNPPLAAPADPAFAAVTWTATTSAYGPLFTLATYPLAWLPVGVAVAALKALAAASVLGLAALAARIAAWRGADPLRAAAFVALNPLVLVHVVGGAHNDGLAVLLAMLGVAAVLSAREAAGGATLLAAVAVKASALVVAPFALLAAARSLPAAARPFPAAPRQFPAAARPLPAATTRPFPAAVSWPWFFTHAFRAQGTARRGLGRFLAGTALAALAIGVAAYLGFGWHWLHAFGLAGENQGRTSYMSVPVTVARLGGLDPGPVRAAALALYTALVAYLLAWTWRGGDWVRAAAWASLGLLLASSWLLPWYLIWPLPLAAVSRDRPLQLLTLALTAYQLGARIPL